MPEYWDICDENGIPTGRIHEKGKPMHPGEYHMAVTVWIRNRKGEFLLSRRLPNARHDPHFWEPTGGSVLAGEDSLTAALREVREELGLTLDPCRGMLFKRYNWPHGDGNGMAHFCTWIFTHDVSLDEVILQPTETCDAMWADENTIRRLIREGIFVPYTYLEELFAYCRAKKRSCGKQSGFPMNRKEYTMTASEIRRIALEQSAIDAGCTPEDFTAGEIRTCISRPHPNARKYLKLPLFCDFISYGSGVVVSACSEEIAAMGRTYVQENPYPYTFETPSLHWLTEHFAPWHARPKFMAEYFLPDPDRIPNLPCPYPTKLLTPPDFTDLYRPEWSNALVEARKELDMLGVGAYDGDRLVGFAACSADCETMWQIGIDVLPEYRRLGIASALTARLTREILDRGKVPFYCAAWSNIGSVRNAITCGFRPAWVHLTCVRQPTE